jgi:hypothetical protein
MLLIIWGRFNDLNHASFKFGGRDDVIHASKTIEQKIKEDPYMQTTIDMSPIGGKDVSVYLRHRYMATCLGKAIHQEIVADNPVAILWHSVFNYVHQLF